MPTKAVNIDERKFRKLKQERLREAPRNGIVVLCLKRPGCDERPNGDYVQYVGALTTKEMNVGVAPEQKSPSGNWDHPHLTGSIGADHALHVTSTKQVIPFLMDEAGEVLSFYSTQKYGPQQPYGFLLGEEHAMALLDN